MRNYRMRACVALLTLLPMQAFAHGSPLVFLTAGIPFGFIAYVVAAIVLVRTGGWQYRFYRGLAWLCGLPVWGCLFIWPWFHWETAGALRPYENWWSFGLPSLWLGLVAYRVLRIKLGGGAAGPTAHSLQRH